MGLVFPMTAKPARAVAFLIAIAALSPVLRAQDNRFEVFEGGKYGYINQEGALVIPIELEGNYALQFSEGRARFAETVKPVPTKYPYVDRKGKLRLFREEKWGFIDLSGVIAVAPRFDAVQDYSAGLAGVTFDTERTSHGCTDCDLNQHWGFIDKQGRMVVGPQYHSVRPFSEGLAAVQNDAGRWGYIDTRGEVVIPFLFETARSFHEGVAVVAVGRDAGYIDKRGVFVVKPRFAVADDFSGGLAAVRLGGKTGYMVIGPAGGRWAFIGTDGKKKFELPTDVETAHDFAEGLAVIEAGGHCGYIDASGAVAIPLKFSFCGDFSEGLADVGQNGRSLYIDRKGHIAIVVPYAGTHPFKNGLAAFDEGTGGPGQKTWYTDKHGNEVWKNRPAL